MKAHCRNKLRAERKRKKNKLFFVKITTNSFTYIAPIISQCFSFSGLFSKKKRESNQNHKALLSIITEGTKNTC